jgi:hypothetical protein
MKFLRPVSTLVSGSGQDWPVFVSFSIPPFEQIANVTLSERIEDD